MNRWFVAALYAPWALTHGIAAVWCLYYRGWGIGAVCVLITLFASYKIRRLLTGAESPDSWDSWAILVLDAFVVLSIAISLPYFRQLPRKSREGADKANLAVMREKGGGVLPVPVLVLPATPHPASAEIRLSTFTDFEDRGTWLLVRAASTSPAVYIDCTHTDSRLSVWSSY